MSDISDPSDRCFDLWIVRTDATNGVACTRNQGSTQRQCVSHGTGSWESRNTSEEMEMPVKQAIAGQRVANQTGLTEMLHALKRVVFVRS